MHMLVQLHLTLLVVAAPGSGVLDDDEVQLREQHYNFRMGAGQRLQRQSSSKAAGTPSSRKGRRRWLEGSLDDSHTDVDAATDFIPASRPDGNTGHIVRMRRGEAWSKFLAYEGCCQVKEVWAPAAACLLMGATS